MDHLNLRIQRLKFEQKGAAEGTFEGWLSVYGNVDEGGDVVERGAFTKTLQENSGRFPLLYRHDDPVGYFHAEDKPQGLFIRGVLLHRKVAKAAEAYELLRSHVLRGLSIGYRAIKHQMREGVRHLIEVRLREGSLVMWPMNEEATVTAVKSCQAAELAALKSINEAARAAVNTMRGSKS